MKKIADIASYFFVLAVTVLSTISILGIWEFFDRDVIYKSFESIGLLAIVAIIIIVADHFISGKSSVANLQANEVTHQPAPAESESIAIFRGLRVFTLTTLIISVALLAFFGILAIWEVLAGEVLHKSIASIAVSAFVSLIIVITCLEREKSHFLKNRNISGGMVLLLIIFAWLAFNFFSIIIGR